MYWLNELFMWISDIEYILEQVVDRSPTSCIEVAD